LKRFGIAEKLFWENNVSKAYILTAFKTTWNCREHFKKHFFKACALRYLKRFGTAEKTMKTMSLKHAFWWYLKLQRNR